MGTERIVADNLGMKVTGEQGLLRKLGAREIRVALTVGIEMTTNEREITSVIQVKDEMTEIPGSLTIGQSVKKQVPGDVLMTGKMT